MTQQPEIPTPASGNDAPHEGRQLELYMRTRGIPATELAHKLGRSTSSIRNYFQTAVFSNRVRTAIHAALGITDEQLHEAGEWPAGHQGKQLEAYLKQQGVNKTDLANWVGRGKSTISKYMGSMTLSNKVRHSILAVLGASYGAVFGAESSPTDPPASPVCKTPQTAHSLVLRHLAEWQTLQTELRLAQAPAAEQDFCQYQIWHLTYSGLPELDLSTVLSTAATDSVDSDSPTNL